MNKSNLIDTLRKETNLTKVQATQVVELLFNKMTEALAAGDRVEIRGFCSFYVTPIKQLGPEIARSRRCRYC